MVKRSHLIHRPAVAICLSIFAVVLLARVCPAAAALVAQDDVQVAADKPEGGRRLGVRLRSFIPTARGQMHFEPTPEGGIVRLTVLGLPRPEVVMTTARTFVVWASASGGRVARVGDLQTDASGNGGLQFTRPPMLESYSVLVTAEPNAAVEKPTGTVVFASLANEVTAFFAQVEKRIKKNQKAVRESSRRAKLKGKPNDFYDEVDLALKTAPGGGRVLELFGQEIAPGARGHARVTTLSLNAYVRARFEHLPPPILANANAYVLWSIVPDGRIIYMGSLPMTSELDETDIYVRVGGFSSDFDLFITAEQSRPVARPSDRRALSARPPALLPQ